MALIRAATFNILHGMSPSDGGTDPERLRSAVTELDADLLGLQEVDRSQPRSGEVDQTALAADSLDAGWSRFVPSVHGTPSEVRTWAPASAVDGDETVGPTYGIGLVSRLPVRSWWVKRFPAAPFKLPLVVPGDSRPRLLLIPDEPRLALAAVVTGPDGPFTVVTAHLSFVPGYNARQLRAITRWVARMPAPVLFMGDFNLPGGLPSRLTGWAALASAPTYPAASPKVQLDHVLALGLVAADVRDSRAWDLPVSDHRALSVDVRI